MRNSWRQFSIECCGEYWFFSWVSGLWVVFSTDHNTWNRGPFQHRRPFRRLNAHAVHTFHCATNQLRWVAWDYRKLVDDQQIQNKQNTVSVMFLLILLFSRRSCCSLWRQPFSATLCNHRNRLCPSILWFVTWKYHWGMSRIVGKKIFIPLRTFRHFGRLVFSNYSSITNILNLLHLAQKILLVCRFVLEFV